MKEVKHEGTWGWTQCDGCERIGKPAGFVRGEIGDEKNEGFHQSFDYCRDNRTCFVAAGIKALEGHAEVFLKEIDCAKIP